MINFVNYLLESGISLSLFALVYFVFLRRETFFSVNRWFLLVSICFSALLPLLHVPFYAPQATLLPEVTVTPYINLLSAVTIYGTSLTQGAERFVLTYSLFGYLYVLGVVFFASKLFIQIYQIIRLIAHNRVVSEGKIKMVILEQELSPFSFLNYIFVSKNLQSTKGWEKMLEHEKQHIRQGHTFDVLVLEFVAVFQWFNPFFWMFRRALRENHEFLADKAVISKGTAPSWYKQILLNQYVGEQIVLTNNFNYSLIKSRINMMSKIKSRKIASIKILIGIVMAASLIVVFACEQKQPKTKIIEVKQIIGPNSEVKQQMVIDSTLVKADIPYSVVEQMPEYTGGESELRNFLMHSVKYPVEASKKGIQGKVFVSFVVAKDGSVSNAKVIRGVDPTLDAEALRVVNSMPKWTPGKQSGKVVSVQYTIPINFALK